MIYLNHPLLGRSYFFVRGMSDPLMSILKNTILGWLLISAMVLYALVLTIATVTQRILELFNPAADSTTVAAQQ
jgi:hypothetical protein